MAPPTPGMRLPAPPWNSGSDPLLRTLSGIRNQKQRNEEGKVRVWVAAALSMGLACAQETIQYASVSGKVTDESGGAIRGAAISLLQTDTNRKNAMVADSEGRFRFAYLRLGPYLLTVTRPGFAVVSRPLTLTAGAAFDLALTLPVAANASTVTVAAAVPAIETARSQVAGTVSRTELETLPLNGRNYLDLALLMPGVAPANTASAQTFAETSAVPGQGLSVDGQRNFSNGFVVDGLSANDDAAGLAGVFLGLDTVQELQVVTSGGQAEFGRALGGYVNVVTRSGTNQLHGGVYGYLHNSRWNAANALSHTVLPLTQTQEGATLGGPAVRDRTFYFANVERRDWNQSGLITILPANVAAINARLDAVGYGGQRLFTGLYPDPVHSTNSLARADHEFGTRDQFTARYSVYRVDSRNSRGAGGLSAASASANLDDTDQTAAFGNVATFSAHTVNETRGQVTRSSLAAPPSDPAGPAVAIAGIASFGTLSGSPTGRANNLYELADNLSHQEGAHAIRLGVDFLDNDDTITFPRANRGSYAFSSLGNFLSGAYNNSGYSQAFGRSVVAQRNPNIGVYLQDEWKATPSLTLNLGLRYDLQYLHTIATDTDNVSPRLGFAWSPGRSRKTVVRGGYGLFYDRVPLRALANAILSANNTTDPASLQQISVSLSPGQAGAPLFPHILGSLTLPPGVLFNFTTMDRRMRNASSQQGSFEVEREVGTGTTLSVGYQRVRGRRLIAAVNQNVPACAASGTNNGCRPNPAFGNDSQYSPAADSRYDGMHVSVVHRPNKWGSFRISYTWSRAFDDVGEFFFSAPMDNYNIRADYGRSDDDQRHRVAFDGNMRGHGFELTVAMQYYSALPFNITTGSNTLQGTAGRPLLNGAPIGRNSGSGFDFLAVNGRVTRHFRLSDGVRLDILAEAFNASNHVNGVSLNGVFGSGAYPVAPATGFRQTTAVEDPRTFQVGARLQF